MVEPLGHADAIRGLWRAAAADRLSHALLVRGPQGVGKFTACVWLAQGLLCRDLAAAGAVDDWRPCGTCPSCKKVASGEWRGNHPDFLRVDPVEEGWDEIPIQAVAERSGDSGGPCVGSFLKLRPAEGANRVVLVREAERLNLPAQNALLKTLEEPSAGTFLLLEASRPDSLLPTIRSRVLEVRLGALSDADTEAVLAASAADDEALAGLDLIELAVLARGAPGEVLRLARTGALALLAAATPLLEGRGDALAAAAAVWEVDGEYQGGTALARDRGRVRLTLELLRDVLAGALRVAATGDPAQAGRGEPARLAQGLSARLGTQALTDGLDGLLRVRRDIDLNLDPGAALERALVGLEAQLGSPAGATGARRRG
ncbi:hypothetical protein [Engelhardtia mirabilis]|uniref:hypothetical protein n=1 Tax=Engelhardtia mirabilis TaxID=2528011 RepID=UPI003AF35DFE